MSAEEALKAAKAAGVDIMLDGEDLVLQAPAPAPAPVLDALSRYKSEIVALLRAGNEGSTLKGQAIELWSNSAGRLFLVADEEDARRAMERFGARRDLHSGGGEAYRRGERSGGGRRNPRMEAAV